MIQNISNSGDQYRNRFSLTATNPGDATFIIDPVSGVVRTASVLDYDTTPSYELEITATDNAGDATGARSATFTLTVNLNDVNDNYPRFEDGAGGTVTQYTTDIQENIGDSGTVTTIHAVDDDGTSPNSDVTFSIDSGDGSSQFAIDATTGVITTAVGQTIDYEIKTSYALVIKAADGGTPSLSSYISLTINIDDVNDNSPVFTPSDFPVSVSEETGTSVTIATVVCSDADAGTNAMISMTLMPTGNTDNRSAHWKISFPQLNRLLRNIYS